MNQEKPSGIAGTEKSTAVVKGPYIERDEPLSRQLIFAGNVLVALEREGATQSHFVLISENRAAAEAVKLLLDKLLNFERAELVAIQQALFLFKSELETGEFTYLWTTVRFEDHLNVFVSNVWNRRLGFDLRGQIKTGLNADVRELCIYLEYFILLYTLYCLIRLHEKTREESVTPESFIEMFTRMSHENFWVFSHNVIKFLTLKQYRAFNQWNSSVSEVMIFMNYGGIGPLGTSKPDFSALKLNLHSILSGHLSTMFGMVATRLDRLEAVKK